MLLAQFDSSLLCIHTVQVYGCALQLLALDEVGEICLVGLRVIANGGPEFERAINWVDVGLEACELGLEEIPLVISIHVLLYLFALVGR